MRLIHVLLTTMVFAAYANAKADGTKIALVDIQKVINSTVAGKKAKGEFEAEGEKRKKEIQKKETDLNKIKEDFEKKKSVLSEEVLQKKQAEFQEEVMKYQELVGKSRAEMQKKEGELMKPILEKMKKVIDKVAKEKKLDLILENTAMVLYAESGVDITADVIKNFEKEK